MSLSEDAARSGDDRRSIGEMGAAQTAQQAVTDSAVRAARAVHDRARFQHNQLARLRRSSFDVVGVPFVWGGQLDLAAVRGIAKRLERKL